VGACDSFYVHGIAEKDTYIARDTVGPVEEGKYARLTSDLASCLSLSSLGSRSSILLPDTGLWVVNFKKKVTSQHVKEENGFFHYRHVLQVTTTMVATIPLLWSN
jgi:hypothetical protein